MIKLTYIGDIPLINGNKFTASATIAKPTIRELGHHVTYVLKYITEFGEVYYGVEKDGVHYATTNIVQATRYTPSNDS